MNPIQKLNEFNPIVGDDLPYVSFIYRDVPKGFRISDIQPLSDAVLTAQYWPRLTAAAERHFRNREILGQTFVDFFDNLQDAYYLNADTLEKALKVYYDDIANPTQSRTIKRTHSETETLPNSERVNEIQHGQTINRTGSSSGSDTGIEYAIEGTDSTPSTKNETETQATDSETHGGTDTETENITGGTREFSSEDTEDWSDVGVAPNYDLMNGFLDNNRTMEFIFCSFFDDCFTISEGLKW